MPAKRSTDDAWCILRCSGQKTLRLATTLADDNFEVWTPIETRTVKVPKANVRREVMLPIMPSYVFAKATRLIDLLQIAGRPAHAYAHADFSVMRHGGLIPLINDDSLQALRRTEARRSSKRKAVRVFAPGLDVTVKTEGGSFAGMHGTVKRSDSGYSLVLFGKSFEAKIPTFLLDESDVRNGDPYPHFGRKAA